MGHRDSGHTHKYTTLQKTSDLDSGVAAGKVLAVKLCAQEKVEQEY